MKRLYSLDALRGLAALAVVVWHWQHFFAITGTWQEGWQRQSQPFYWLLKPLYLDGWAAVDLFFALSGFVFFWLYSEAIRTRKVGAGKFALLRFSRLYPLHFVTLIAAAVLQLSFHNATGGYFIFDDNTWRYFVPSLVIAQQWLPPSIEQSFNGPSWSVSIEVLLYCIFFLLCRAGLRGPKTALLVSLCGIPMLMLGWNEFIARGIMGYFLGGVAFYAVEQIKLRSDAKRIARIIAAMALFLWGVVVVETLYGPLHAACYWLSGHISDDLGRIYIGESDNLFLALFIYSASPMTIMALALHEQVLGGVYKRLAWLGDISYSTYMLHFPLQIGLALIWLHFGLNAALFQTDAAMVLFYAGLIGLGLLSYRYFERPMQSFIRSLQARWAARHAVS